MAFYKCLQQVSGAYLIPLMPFDSVCLTNNYEGLFPPRLGTSAYAECAIAVMELLIRVLPEHDPEIDATISAVHNSSRNGYDLLWRVLALYVPGFDPTIPIAQPVWSKDSEVLDFSQSHLLYFRLQAKKGIYYTPQNWSNIFLRAMAPSDYADVVTNLQTMVDAFHQPDDWNDWQESEYLQLNQYNAQNMFGMPVFASEDDAVFHLVWTYNIKAVDGRKKARCVCNGSTRSGKVLVLAETYANCVDQTSVRLFYAVASAENLLIFGSDVSNAFAKAPPPKQPFFIRPDKAFCEWWTKHLKRNPIGRPDYPCPLGHARTSQIASLMGKTCRRNFARHRFHAYGTQTLPIFRNVRRQPCPLYATG